MLRAATKPTEELPSLHEWLRRLRYLSFLAIWLCRFTDLDAAFALMPDKHAGAVEFVLAYDSFSTLPNWDNLLQWDSEFLEGHLLDRLHTPLEHYSPLWHTSLLTLLRSRQVLPLQLSCQFSRLRHLNSLHLAQCCFD